MSTCHRPWPWLRHRLAHQHRPLAPNDSAAQLQLSAPPPPPPPTGAILPVYEVFANDSKEFLGTLTIISADGIAATARHVVVWGDGRMHPRRLFVGDGDVQARHLASFPVVDVNLLRLLRTTAGLLGVGSGDSGGAVGGRSSSSSSTGFKRRGAHRCWRRDGGSGSVPAHGDRPGRVLYARCVVTARDVAWVARAFGPRRHPPRAATTVHRPTRLPAHALQLLPAVNEM